jgi:hypothetical protein
MRIWMGARNMSFFDGRQNERYEFSDQKVEYTFGLLSKDEIFEAELINASETGLCMLSPHRLTVGQEITLTNFMDFTSRTAIVIWIAESEETGDSNKSDQALFKIGLQFSE